MRGLLGAVVSATLLLAAARALAGWEIDQTTYSLRASGKEISRVSSSLRISKGRVRVSDGKSITIVDYEKDRLTYLYPERKMYWAGTSDDYIAAVQGSNPRRRTLPDASAADSEEPKRHVAIQDTPITTDIGGKKTKKYLIHVNGEKIQEVWVVPAFGVGKDLDFERFGALQSKLAQSVRSTRAKDLVALNQDESYKKLNRETFTMRTHSYLGEAIMGTEVLRVAEVDIPESDFTVPEEYTQVPLLALLEAQNALSEEEKAAATTKRTPAPAKKRQAVGIKGDKKNAPKE